VKWFVQITAMMAFAKLGALSFLAASKMEQVEKEKARLGARLFACLVVAMPLRH